MTGLVRRTEGQTRLSLPQQTGRYIPMILVLGEILFDLFPDGRRIGGAPFNFAFHLKQLGFEVAFVSRVGRDDLGEEILSFIAEKGFDPGHIQVDPYRATGTVEIEVTGEGDHRFSILRNRAYDHLEWNGTLQSLCTSGPEMVYYGTLIQRSSKGRTIVAQILTHSPDALRFCDVNLRPDCWTRETARNAMNQAHILKLNREELDILVPPADQDPVHRAHGLLGPGGQGLVILTQGEKGAVWVTDQGTLTAPAGRDTPLRIADTVGAGDAYAAMAAAGRLAGLPDRETLVLAQEFAGFICTVRGALPGDTQIYSTYKERLTHAR